MFYITHAIVTSIQYFLSESIHCACTTLTVVADAEVDAFCGDEFVCQFDYKTTMQRQVANSTVHSKQAATNAKYDVTSGTLHATFTSVQPV